MKLYRFSPVETESGLHEAIKYLTEQETLLATNATGKSLPITYLTIFAHYDDEYEQLVRLVENWGQIHDANNGIKVSLREPLQENIPVLRIRKPDPYRMQVGCCDFGVENYEVFKATNLGQNKNLRLIARPEYEMVEFFDPDLDVLAYVVSS